MTIPADSLPGDHLRTGEKETCREALCHYIQAHPTPISAESVLSDRLEACLCADARDAVCLDSIEREGVKIVLCRRMERAIPAAPRYRVARYAAGFARGVAPRAVAALCLVLVLGNGVAWAANDTLPGDQLYPLKVGVIEPARALITVTTEGRAQWASTCVRRRLLEAERLIAENSLKPEHWNAIEESMNRNIAQAQRHIRKIAEQDPEVAADLSADLETTLIVHQVVLDEIQQDQPDDMVMAVYQDIGDAASVATELHAGIEQRVSADTGRLQRVARRAMGIASSAVSDLSSSLPGAEQTNDPPRLRMNAAKTLLDNAEKEMSEERFAESFKAAREAVRKAEEGKVILRMGIKFRGQTSSSSVSSAVSSSSSSSVSSLSSISSLSSASSQSATVSSSSSSVSSLSSSSSSSSLSSSSVSSVSSESLSSNSSQQSSARLPVDLPLTVPLPDIPGLQ